MTGRKFRNNFNPQVVKVLLDLIKSGEVDVGNSLVTLLVKKISQHLRGKKVDVIPDGVCSP